ncbi:MAG: hypothetical protein Q7S18_00470 [bacterium]|nr:hypothetical protein [bacterium]
MNIIYASLKDIVETSSGIGNVFFSTWYFIMPPIFYWAFRLMWMSHVFNDKFLPSIQWVLLEIIPPQNIEKSPKLMESFFAGIHGVDTTIPNNEKYILGRAIEFFSLELVGDSGDIHFYIRAPKWDQGIIESNIYAQYPDAQIVEVDDYITTVPKIIPNKNWEVWGADAKLAGPDPMPIKTYNKFQEDITGKMIDPLSSVLEIMGRLGPNQKIWFQILINPAKEGKEWPEYKKGQAMIDELAGKKSDKRGLLENLKTDVFDVFGNLFKALHSEVEFPSKEEKKDEAPLEFRLTPGEKERLKALEENMTKNQFRCQIRFVYLGRRENFDKPGVVGGFWGAMKQFSDMYSNGITIQDHTKTYAWYFMVKSRLRWRQRRLVQRYIDREPEGTLFTLSTTELATIFHLPDMSAMAPSIPRVASKLGGAPANLPFK